MSAVAADGYNGIVSASKYLGVLVSALATAVAVSVFAVQPAAAEAARAHVVGQVPLGGSVSQIDVYSPSMDRVVTNRVIRAAGGGPAPTLYLLTGIGGGVDGISWWDDTDVREFFADKRVNVVMPVGGAYSMYTDWRADDPAVGRNRWQTYLTRELPPTLDAELGTTGRNAIAGVSMSAGSAIDLAIQAPEVYDAVAAYSGCPWAADAAGAAMVTAQVIRGGGNPGNMWGSPGDALWRAHDAFANASALAGKTIFLSAATGTPGAIDRGLPFPPLEAIASSCTAAFAERLEELGLPAIHVNRSEGSHTWGQFETDLHDSWPHLASALGA
ncbi:Diacylglycerol acyltransferase/mycolyltransferase Ag85A [Nocardia gamkensis]|uniref:Esterase family protein n=1 Tax=Nocardia gamkensis TaxID=352869 RepID=A0A7X6R3U7_9NOCA|nr:esterase family protein [Nocardia gamkensis]NQE67478.1 Diacylglycerol acyltransferase/mycolyltransferase Ag85A [Nocardia gamkensis]